MLFHKAYTKREFLNSSKNKLRYVIFSVFLVTIIGIWMYSLILFNDFSYYVISIAMYVSIVSFQIYNIARETGKVRYYDHIAVISFVLSMLLGPFNYLMYYVYFFPWIYAGVKSIIESYEGTDDE
uniref:Uncharacterized protein n=2 Tax=Metallosphaera hakonensis TaxID=79601 RepID=A0A2U9IRD6_9CREN